jgi:hypothetical protein
MSKLKTAATATGGGLSGLGMIGLGIYGIGEVHGYLNVIIFVSISISLLFLTSKFMGSRKQKKELIVYNPNEIFILSLLFFLVLIGLYSCYSIYQSESKLGESITSYAIIIVGIIGIALPIFTMNSYLKNRNDNIVIGSKSIVISDNEKSIEFVFSDILSYKIQDSKLLFSIETIGNKAIDLSELNLNKRDIEKLNTDLQIRIKNTNV